MHKKIIVIGSPGSGKSYFSKKLSARINIPLYHMDNIFWHADQTHITREALRKEIAKIMEEKEWIIDGNYSTTLEERMKACETVIFLDYSVEQCLEGIQSRVGKARDDMPWIEHEVDDEFVQLVKNFKVDTKPTIEQLLEKNKEKEIIIFRTRSEAQQFIDEKVE